MPAAATAAGRRRAAPSDAAAIGDLTPTAYATWVPVIGREPTPMTLDCGARVRSHRIDLLHVNGHLAALIELVPEVGYIPIGNVAVLPAMRLDTNTLLAENVQLYRRLGCRMDRKKPFEGSFTVYMSKPFGSPTCQHMHAQGG